MSFTANLPLFCIVACLACSVVSSVLNGKAARYLSMALCAGCCICSCLVLQMVLRLLSEQFPVSLPALSVFPVSFLLSSSLSQMLPLIYFLLHHMLQLRSCTLSSE